MTSFIKRIERDDIKELTAHDRYQERQRIAEEQHTKRVALAQPVDAINMSQERVDETAKGKHEWKGLDGEIPGLGLVTEEFYNGMIVAEDILREKNT